ncbi:hypothetical protein SNE40_004611 [Patella caerulea]|uniref:Uncharacterized protein n=1 Tax=Patella caerulea TaxID=87958 RepID=A0AAN8Q5Q2_PATCE
MSTQHQEKKLSEETTQEIESNKNAAQAAAQENLQVLKTRSGNQNGMTRNQDILLDQSVRPEDSISQVNSQASNGSNKSKASSTSSQVKKRLLEETAKRKAIEVQMEALKAEQEIAERRFQGQLQREIEELRMKHRREEEENRLKREEEFLKIKSQLEQATVVERIYAQAQENQSLVVPSPSLSPSSNKVSLQQAGDNSTSASYDLQKTGNNSPPTNTCSGIQVAPVSNGIQVAPVSNSIQVAPATSTDVLKEFLDNLITNQHSNSLALKLPSHEVPIFSGNPLEYTHFIRAFENLIEERTNSESSRLYYLVQYTSGEVKELMQSCLSMKEGEGYQAAKKLLKQRFGQNYKIATAYVERLTRGPAIRSEDSAALQNLSVCLTTCRNVLKDIGYLSQIENPDSLRRIIARLPYDTRKRWRSNVDNIIVKFDREIKLEDIVDFVDRESRIANHPVFGDISDKRKSEVEKKMLYTSKQRGISFATHADSNYESNNHHSCLFPTRESSTL